MKRSDILEVFAGTLWQATMVKSLLDDAGIDSFIKDGIMGTLEPWNTDAGGAGPIKIFVAQENFDEASLIVSDYQKNLRETK